MSQAKYKPGQEVPVLQPVSGPKSGAGPIAVCKDGISRVGNISFIQASFDKKIVALPNVVFVIARHPTFCKDGVRGVCHAFEIFYNSGI